jgi:hypothetical protein
MKRELWELKLLAQDSRVLLFAIRKVYSRGPPPLVLRNRFKSRLNLLKTRLSEIQRAVSLSKSLTLAQQSHFRKELGGVRGHCREIERFVTGKAGTAAPAPAVLRRAPSAIAGPGDDQPPVVRSDQGHCPICGVNEPGETLLPCPSCGVGYHPECWEYFGGCAIYGCSGSVPKQPGGPGGAPAGAPAGGGSGA